MLVQGLIFHAGCHQLPLTLMGVNGSAACRIRPRVHNHVNRCPSVGLRSTAITAGNRYVYQLHAVAYVDIFTDHTSHDPHHLPSFEITLCGLSTQLIHIIFQCFGPPVFSVIWLFETSTHLSHGQIYSGHQMEK